MKNFLKAENFKHKINYDYQTLPFKYEETSVVNGHPDILFHWHNEFEFQYVLGGSARYHIDSEYFESQTGDLILIRPNAAHSIHPLENRGHETISLLFPLDIFGAAQTDQTSMIYFQPLQTNTFKTKTRISIDAPGYVEIRSCLLTILDLVKGQPPYFELPLKSKLFEFFYLLYRHHYIVEKETPDHYRKNEKLRQIIEYIQEHYNEDLRIEELAKLMGYSQPHFMALFKEQTGSSCIDFIIQVRLRAASQELVNTMDSIVTIAHSVGFNNLSNFNRQFKRYFNCTPSAYRKMGNQASKPDHHFH